MTKGQKQNVLKVETMLSKTFIPLKGPAWETLLLKAGLVSCALPSNCPILNDFETKMKPCSQL